MTVSEHCVVMSSRDEIIAKNVPQCTMPCRVELPRQNIQCWNPKERLGKIVMRTTRFRGIRIREPSGLGAA